MQIWYVQIAFILRTYPFNFFTNVVPILAIFKQFQTISAYYQAIHFKVPSQCEFNKNRFPQFPFGMRASLTWRALRVCSADCWECSFPQGLCLMLSSSLLHTSVSCPPYPRKRRTTKVRRKTARCRWLFHAPGARSSLPLLLRWHFCNFCWSWRRKRRRRMKSVPLSAGSQCCPAGLSCSVSYCSRGSPCTPSPEFYCPLTVRCCCWCCCDGSGYGCVAFWTRSCLVLSLCIPALVMCWMKVFYRPPSRSVPQLENLHHDYL